MFMEQKIEKIKLSTFIVFAIAVCLHLTIHSGLAQTDDNYDLTWSTIDGGGITLSGGGYVLGSTVGQVDIGQFSGGGYTLVGGFWSGVTSPVTLALKRLYIPLIQNNFVSAPDLIVEEVIVTETDVVTCIKNVGSVASTESFWVDLYVDPVPEPTRVNQVWADGRSQHGLVWGVTTTIAPEQLLCLTIGDAYFWPSLSDFPASLPEGTPIYVQVDSANVGTSYGAVLETHEVNGNAYNNIVGPVLSTSANTLTASIESFSNSEGRRTETTQPLPFRPQ